MYLQPWQIFLGGCLCGIFIAFIVITLIIIRIAVKSGVRIEKEEEKKNNE